MLFKGVLERMDDEFAYVLLGEEAAEARLPLAFLPEAAEVNDIFRFQIVLAVPASEVCKMKAKNLLEILGDPD